MTRYTMPARSQGKMYAQRTTARLERYDVHSLAPEVESAVRKWLLQRLDAFYCELRVVYTSLLSPLSSHVRSTSLAKTHIVLNNTPLSTSSMAQGDEAVEVNARGLNARDAVKALIKATGLNPHLSVYGWPFCLDELDDVTAEGGAA